MENPPFSLYLPGKMGIFMGYASFREGKLHVFKTYIPLFQFHHNLAASASEKKKHGPFFIGSMR